jgi:hypothetical protein
VNHGVGLLALQEVFDRAGLGELRGDGAKLRRGGGVSAGRHDLVPRLREQSREPTSKETARARDQDAHAAR